MSLNWMGKGVIALSFAVGAGQVRAEAPVSIWTGCGENKVSGLSTFMVGPTAARNQTPLATAQEGISRCNDALATLDASAPWQRRAALLRSRAKHYVRARDHAAALADLDAISAIEQPDHAYGRSFAVSTHMLRAAAQMQAGRRDIAANEAVEAMRLRPWSERVAQFAFVMVMMRDDVPADDTRRWDQLVLLDSAFFERRAALLARAGDWAGATADWLSAPDVPGAIAQTYITLPNVVVQGAPGIPVKGVDVQRTVDAVITAAMAGRADLADGWLADLRRNIDAPPPQDGLAKRLGAGTDPAAQKAELEKWSALIQVAKVAGSGDMAGATSLLAAMHTIPISTVTTAMLKSIATRAPAPVRGRLESMVALIRTNADRTRDEHLAQLDPDTLLGDLPDHEEVMLANPYRSAVKFLRANGASAKVDKDGKAAKVSFFGNKSQPFAIDEMTLLRAAELTLEQRHAAFRIVSNDGYVQTSTMTMYGTPVGPSTVSGNSVVMSIEFVDPATKGAVNAAEVRSALGPIYIKEAPETKG